MGLGCGCGCDGHGGKGSCMDIPAIGGVTPIAYFGVPSPTGYQGLSGLKFRGLGLAGCGDCITTDPDTGDCLAYDTADCSSGGASVNDIIAGATMPTLPSVNPITGTPTVANPTTTPSSGVNWNSIANAWTNITGKILTSEAGANPTYQSIGPNGASTTIYGNLPANLQASLAQPVAGSLSLGTLLLFGGIGLVALMVLKK